MSAISRIGFVGLGNMGTPMARNLAAAGFELTLADLDATRRAELAAQTGAAEAVVPADFAGVEALITMLPTGVEVREVMLGADGGLAGALPEGAIVIDMSSSDAAGTRELGAELAARGLRMVDAPVSGGVSGAVAGTLAVMVGGADADVERAQPILAALGGRIVRAGSLGSGHAVKALNNYVAAATFTASIEALIIGAGFGLESEAILEAINGSTGRNFNTELTIPGQVLSGAFGTGFSLRLMAKDVALAQALAEATGTDAPNCELMARLWAGARDGAGGEADFTTAAQYWAQENGRNLTS